MLVAELGQCSVEALKTLQTLNVANGILAASQSGQPVAGQLAFGHSVHAPPREAPSLVDKQVVHHPRQPRSGLVDIHEVVEFAVCLDQEFLEQVLRLGFATREAPREPIQPLEVRSYEFLEGDVLRNRFTYVIGNKR